jgi:hypothetical protein
MGRMAELAADRDGEGWTSSQELEYRIYEALTNASKHLSAEDMYILCYATGMDIDERKGEE